MNVCGVFWKRHCELASVKLCRSRVVHPKPIRENRDAKRELWSPPLAGYSRSSGRDFRSTLAGAVWAMRRRAAGKRDRFPVSDRDPGATGRADCVSGFMGVSVSTAVRACKTGIDARLRMPSAMQPSQLGPRVVAPATQLDKGSACLTARLRPCWRKRSGCGSVALDSARRSNRWLARQKPTCAALVEQVRASPGVTPDETGWKVGGHLWWMWPSAVHRPPSIRFRPGRGLEQAATPLGVSVEGFLVRDGLGCLSGFLPGHAPKLLGPSSAALPRDDPGGRSGCPRVSPQREEILQQSLLLRDRRDRGQVGEPGVAVARGRLEARLDRTLQRSFPLPQNRRRANHPLREREALFTFLDCPGLEATNRRAERAIRPMVVTRKVGPGTALPEEHARTASWSAFCRPSAINFARSHLSCRS
jgi:Transposase IS66 family